MKKERLRKDIKSYLRSYLNKNTNYNPYYKDPNNLYLAITVLLKNFYTLSKKDFNIRLRKLKTDIRSGMSFGEASDSFLSFLAMTDEEGQRSQKFPWGLLKHAWDMLFNPSSPDYLDEDLKFLVAFKSYLLEPNRSSLSLTLPHRKAEIEPFPYFPDYILSYLNIPHGQYEKDPETKEKVEKINNQVNGALIYLRMMLNMIPWLVRKYPGSSRWLKDVFGVSSWRYTNPMERKSHNKPDYKRSYRLFEEKIGGKKSYTQLGFGRNEKGNFIKLYRPQGALVFLKKIYTLLYGITESLNETISQKKTEIEKILENTPLRKRILKDLCSK